MRFNLKKQLIKYCVVSSLTTMAAGFIFVETVYLPIRKSGKNRESRKDSKPVPPNRLLNERALKVAKEYARHIVEQRKSKKLSVQKHNEIMKLINDLKIKHKLRFMGIKLVKIPADLWMMQQVMFEIRPDYVIEAGTLFGGSALYWAYTLDGLGLKDSKVITIDIKDRTQEVSKLPLWQKYVTFIQASSTSPETVSQISEMVKGKKVLVTLDSNHHMHHVLEELRLYGPLVSPGSYLVVEDTFIDGVPVSPKYGPGPMAAVIKYLEGEGRKLFVQDASRESLIFSRNTGGWLRRRFQ